MTYTRPFDITDHPDYDREDFINYRTCTECGEKGNQDLMIQEQLSGLWMHEECKDSFLKQWEANPENTEKPIFKYP